ncbi:hypothetical protein TrCOL_g6754 [Triparma columacea]|uniref:SLC26A/SulP transporter domain-containing protein n=1 Tax=Triparma columacea TaxID=722753 RepID=A0A9W7G184_9STRA|nr:hypothetical protein TrCOL_g6754 [Triparma columacea]
MFFIFLLVLFIFCLQANSFQLQQFVLSKGGLSDRLQSSPKDFDEDPERHRPAILPPPTTYTTPSLTQEVLAGTTVSFSLLTKALACSAIVGVSPLVGLWSSAVMGGASFAFGMRPGVIAGSAAVAAVPLGAFVSESGGRVDLIPAVVILSAVFEFSVAALNQTRLIELVSESILAGFLNALSLLLFLSQLKMLSSPEAVSVTLLCAAISQFLPSTVLPSSLVGITVASAISPLFNLPTLGSTFDPSVFSFGFSAIPAFLTPTEILDSLQNVDLQTLSCILPASFTIAFISTVETLLAAKMVDDFKCEDLCAVFIEDEELVDSSSPPPSFSFLLPSDVPTQSVLALSAGNAISALLGGFGGCALIPQTVLNLNSGGGSIASMISFTATCSLIILLSPLLSNISLAALTGVMFTVCYQTVQWNSMRRIFSEALEKRHVVPLVTLIVTSIMSYKVDFGTGCILGILTENGLTKILLPPNDHQP